MLEKILFSGLKKKGTLSLILLFCPVIFLSGDTCPFPDISTHKQSQSTLSISLLIQQEFIELVSKDVKRNINYMNFKLAIASSLLD